MPNVFLLVNAGYLTGLDMIRRLEVPILTHPVRILLMFAGALLMHRLHLFGGADLKIFLLLSLWYPAKTILVLFAGSVILAAVFSLPYLAVTGSYRRLFGNYKAMLEVFVKGGDMKQVRKHFHRFPYTVAITASYLCMFAFYGEGL